MTPERLIRFPQASIPEIAGATPGLVAVGPNVSPHCLPVYMRGGDGTHAQQNFFVERPLLKEREKGRTRPGSQTVGNSP
jgi:hypothetical protein